MCAVCAFSFAFGLAVPTLQLLFWAVEAFSGPRAVTLAAGTARSVIAAGTGFIYLAVSLLLLYLACGRKTRAANAAIEIGASGYAVPGAIIAVGVLYLARFVNDHTSLFLFGTLGVLVYAYAPQDRLPEASLPSLMIIAAGVGAAMLLMKQQRNVTGATYRVSGHH